MALLQLVATQPHGMHSTASTPVSNQFLLTHHLGARHVHHKRDVVTEIDVVTVEASEVVVYVDQKGNFLTASTFANNIPKPTISTEASSSEVAKTTASAATQASSTEAASSSHTPPATTLVSTTKSTPPPPPPTTSAAPPPPPPSPSPSPSPAPIVAVQQPQHKQGPGFGSAIAYSPYNENQSCRSPSQVATDIAGLSQYQVIRLYGTDCNQVSNVLNSLGKGQQIIAGIFDLGSIPSEVATIASAVNGNWGLINTVSVGNELVQNGTPASDVIAAIAQARGALKAAGYNGPVVTVDTMGAMASNIALCEASDYCAINCHPFFDPNTAASGAGAFVLGWVQKISALAGGKMTVVTETGWPHQGQSHGMAVPSVSDQQAALASLTSTFSSNMVLFSAYNNLWRPSNAGTYYAEQYWGIHGNAPSGP